MRLSDSWEDLRRFGTMNRSLKTEKGEQIYGKIKCERGDYYVLRDIIPYNSEEKRTFLFGMNFMGHSAAPQITVKDARALIKALDKFIKENDRGCG